MVGEVGGRWVDCLMVIALDGDIVRGSRGRPVLTRRSIRGTSIR